ncbi:MAG: BLUF domain-containing protein [Pseudomonadota bacterium]
MQLYHLVYFSNRISNSHAELQQILSVSRRNNADIGLTGALFACDDHYFQVLEGPRSALSRVLQVVMNDTRHSDVVISLCEPIEVRAFGAWRMAEMSANNPRLTDIYRMYTEHVTSPAELNGEAIWDMIVTMHGVLDDTQAAETA